MWRKKTQSIAKAGSAQCREIMESSLKTYEKYKISISYDDVLRTISIQNALNSYPLPNSLQTPDQNTR